MSKEVIMKLLQSSHQFRQHEYTFTKKLYAANLFFEPSTRTKTSFTMAEKKLGMETLEFTPTSSSMEKGESLYDTAKTFEAIGVDVLVIRHQDDDWAKELQHHLSIPMINAGAGKKEHPTQCLLDADIIYQEFGEFEGLQIVIAGDIMHSRVAHSNAALLSKLGAQIYLTGAPVFRDHQMPYPFISMDEAVEIADVMMLLRIQHERHQAQSMQLDDYHERYGLTIARERRMKKHAIILHPAPVNRGVEIDSSLVECERSRIFKQMTNGVFVRMAVLTKQQLNWGIIDEYHIEKRNTSFRKQSTRNIRFAN